MSKGDIEAEVERLEGAAKLKDDKSQKDTGAEEERANIMRKQSEREKKCKCLSMTEGVMQNVSHPLRYYEFTQEEVKALEQCDKESFYLRCLPMSTGLAALTYGAIRFGILRNNPHFGPFPKMAFAMVVGYFGGLVASKPLCDEKFRKLPAASHLGTTMREYHEKMMQEIKAAAEAKAKREEEREANWQKRMAEKRANKEAADKKKQEQAAAAAKAAK